MTLVAVSLSWDHMRHRPCRACLAAIPAALHKHGSGPTLHAPALSRWHWGQRRVPTPDGHMNLMSISEVAVAFIRDDIERALLQLGQGRSIVEMIALQIFQVRQLLGIGWELEEPGHTQGSRGVVYITHPLSLIHI